MSKRFSWSSFLWVGVLLIAGPAVRAQEEGKTPLTLDEEYARLAEEVPGFGGLYLDAEGTTHVYLRDLSRAREVEDLGERVEVHPGEYDFRDLFAWKEAVRPQLARKGALSLDIDERRNRLVFGVERESLDAFTSELRTFLRGARIPPEAVLVEAAEPMVPLELLTDRIRPVPGGVQIMNGETEGVCTVGVNATRSGVKGFVTASHCTTTRSVVDGTIFHQAEIGFLNMIGTEIADPPFFTGSPCPSGRKCRYSDAAFVDYVADSQSAGGLIANPLICGFSSAPLLVDPGFPRVPVTGVSFGSPVAGSVVTKVGRTTGCTFGAMQSTCFDTNVLGGITMLCQNQVSAGAQPGDSGSPVFLDYGEEVTLVGILWGGNSGSFVFSPWLSVHGELGGSLLPVP